MKPFAIAPVLALLCAIAAPATAADELQLQRLATCQDSWFDWKDDNARMARFAQEFQNRYTRQTDGPAFVPKSAMTAFGMPVSQVFPQSVGMAVGYSVIVNADFAQTLQVMEKQLGRPMKCSTSDGSRGCELHLGENRTAVLMTGENGRGKTSLMGCYYFYEK